MMNLDPRKMIDLMFRKRCVEIGLKKEGILFHWREGGSISTATTDEAVGVYVRTMHKKPHHMHSTLRITATRCPMFPDPVVFSKFDPTDNWFLCEAKKESQRLLTRCAETRTWDLGLRRIQLHLHENSSSRKQADGDRKFNEINQS